eukprot:8860779-Alexandrium_andersonii.AAC.1
MSASLVGSEMCIRDRVHVPVDPRRHVLVEAAALEGRQDVLEEGRDPVSYTHLTLPTICSV